MILSVSTHFIGNIFWSKREPSGTMYSISIARFSDRTRLNIINDNIILKSENLRGE